MKNTHKALIRADKTIVLEKIKEAFASVLPISVIVLILAFTICPIESGVFLAFILGALAVIVGMGLFSIGADIGMTPIGQYVGSTVVKSKKLILILPIYFIVGVLITISEPDLQVLATQLQGVVGKYVLLLAVGVGVGVFLVIAFLRMVLRLKLSYLLLVCYIAVFVLSIFVPSNFVPLAFDSGGVTTGPMSVPFILAIGTGVASIRSDKDANAEGFGLTALCSIGPIIAVMILGIIAYPEAINLTPQPTIVISTSKELLQEFGIQLPVFAKEVAIALLPIVGVFISVFAFGRNLGKGEFIRIMVGVIYTFIGLVIFLTGVNVGFAPIGAFIGHAIGKLDYNWIIIPIGMLVGYFMVAAEPAVHVLTVQVYQTTGGQIPKKALSISLMFGTAISVALAMVRILTGLPIMYFLIPGYAIALILTFIVPEMFTAIAFDSGGVASGAMTACFLMPLAQGLCGALGGNMMADGFGVVAMVAMTPLIAIQILGLTYKIKLAKLKNKQKQQIIENQDIIE